MYRRKNTPWRLYTYVKHIAVWDGSIVLARYLEVYGATLGLTSASRCLELGSGTGLLGMWTLLT